MGIDYSNIEIMGIDYSNIVEDRSSYNFKEELEKNAYFNWLNAGCPEGRHVEFWCEAEREMFGFTADEYWDAMEDIENAIID